MYHPVMRTLEHTLDEMQYWTAAVRVGKVSPSERPFLAAHARQTATAIFCFYNALRDTHPEHPNGNRGEQGGPDMLDQLTSPPEYVWPWLPDAVSAVRVLSTIEQVARRWCEKLPHATMTESERLALRWEAGRTAEALEAFATFVETFKEDAALERSALWRQS